MSQRPFSPLSAMNPPVSFNLSQRVGHIFSDLILIFPVDNKRIRVRLSPASADGSLEAEMSVNHQPNPHYTSPLLR